MTTLIELIAQAIAGDDADVWNRASDQWRKDRIADVRRGFAIFADPPKAAVWPVAYACMAEAECLNKWDAERVAKAALATLADLR